MPKPVPLAKRPWAAWSLLAVAVLLWGANWPIMKMGLAYSDPLWFAVVRALLAAATVTGILAAQRRLAWPARADWPVLFSIGVVQVGACMSLLHGAVLFADAGRSAVLAYTTPIWAAPMAFLFLAERLHPLRIVSLALGIGGLGVLFLPTLEGPVTQAEILGIVLPSVSAVLWAGVIVHVRGHRWRRPLIDLMPWQFLLGAGVQAVLAVTLVGPPAMTLNPQMLAILFYNGVPATVLAFWAYLTAASRLPANATAIGSLGIPMIGLLSAGLVLGESLNALEWLAVGLLASGIALSSFRFGKR